MSNRTTIQKVGESIQLKGPFASTYSFEVANKHSVKIGFSIGQKDFMELADPQFQNNFAIRINDEQIQIGRTFIYEPGDAIKNLKLQFPNGAPQSMIVDIICVD